MTQILEASQAVTGHSPGFESVEEVAAQIGVSSAGFQEMVKDHRRRRRIRWSVPVPRVPRSNAANYAVSNARSAERIYYSVTDYPTPN